MEITQGQNRDLAWEQVRDSFINAGFIDPEKIDTLRNDPDRLLSLAGTLVRYAAATGQVANLKKDESPGARRYRWELQKQPNGTYPLDVIEEIRQEALTIFDTDKPASRNARTFISLILGLSEEGSRQLATLDLRQGQASAYGEKTLYDYYEQRARGWNADTGRICSDGLRMHLKGATDVQIKNVLNVTSNRSSASFRMRLRTKLLEGPDSGQLHRTDFVQYLTPDQQRSLPQIIPDFDQHQEINLTA